MNNEKIEDISNELCELTETIKGFAFLYADLHGRPLKTFNTNGYEFEKLK